MLKAKRYILVDKLAVEEPDLTRWEAWYSSADRVVKKTEIPITENNRFRFKILNRDCTIHIVTTFLGIDHALHEAKPLLYETQIIGGPHDQRRQWNSTWDDAIQEHDFTVDAILTGGFICRLKHHV